MAERLELDSEVHDLVLGKSFDKSAPIAFHALRYDFKPASVDTSQPASVDIGEGSSVTVQVPHVEQRSGTSHTLYKGNKRPTQKECVLIIDHDAGQITLERLATNVSLKKARKEKHNIYKGTSNSAGKRVLTDAKQSKACNILPVTVHYDGGAKNCDQLENTGSGIKSQHDSKCVPHECTHEAYGDIVNFARATKDDLAVYLERHKGYCSKRPHVTAKYGIDSFQREHPELYSKAKRRSLLSDSDIDRLNAYICTEWRQLLSGIDVYNRLQLLEDATDFLLDRLEGSTRVAPPPSQPRPLTPSEKPAQTTPPRRKPAQPEKTATVVAKDMPIVTSDGVLSPGGSGVADMEISDTSSSDSNSDDDSDDNNDVQKTTQSRPPFTSTLSDDLHLSESGSDSDF